MSNSGNGDREKCGCDQHWLVTDMTETELVLAYGPINMLKRKRDGKLFVGNPKHGRQLSRGKRTYRWVPITDKTQITLALLGGSCFVARSFPGCRFNHPESYPCIIADGTFKDGPRVWKPVPENYVDLYDNR